MFVMRTKYSKDETSESQEPKNTIVDKIPYEMKIPVVVHYVETVDVLMSDMKKKFLYFQKMVDYDDYDVLKYPTVPGSEVIGKNVCGTVSHVDGDNFWLQREPDKLQSCLPGGFSYLVVCYLV